MAYIDTFHFGANGDQKVHDGHGLRVQAQSLRSRGLWDPESAMTESLAFGLHVLHRGRTGLQDDEGLLLNKGAP